MAVRGGPTMRVIARPNARADLRVVVAPAVAVVVDAGRIVRIAVRIAGVVAPTLAPIVAVVVHVPVTPAGVVAPDDSRVRRLVANRRLAVRRRRLVSRRNAVNPDAAHSRRRPMTRRHILVVLVTAAPLCAGRPCRGAQ